MTYRNLVRRYLTAQALAYMTAGIFLVISHHLNYSTFLRYFGHLLIATSFVIIISIFFYQLARRITVLDTTFSQTLSIVTVAALIISTIDEIAYNNAHQELGSQGLSEFSFFGILLVMVLWLIIFILLPPTRRRLRLNFQSISGIFFLISILFIFICLISIWKNIFSLIYSYLFLGTGILLYGVLFVLLQRQQTPNHICRLGLLGMERILFLLIIVFVLAGFISMLTKAFHPGYFFGPGLSLFCYLLALGPRFHYVNLFRN